MARVRGWTLSLIALCFVGASACMPDPGVPGNRTSTGSGGSQSTSGRGGSSSSTGGSGGASGGSDNTGGSSPAGTGGGGSGGGSSQGGSSGGSTQGGRGGSANAGTGGAGGSTPAADGAASSDSGGSGGDTATAPAAPKLSTDVLPILKMRCALAGCHDPVKVEHGMNLSTAATAFTALVNKPTSDHCRGNMAVVRVVPGKPENSFVVTLIEATPGRCADQARMPPAPRPVLPSAEVKTIRDWIAAGAKND